jgi:outer membrane protein assembly factor BamB
MKVKVHDTNVPGALEVVSLTTGKNGMIYGGYTGAKDHLFFEYDPAKKVSVDLGSEIVSSNVVYDRGGRPVTQKVHHALATLPDGRIVGGTGTNVSYGSRHYKMLEDEGGHAFVYDPRTGKARDLGIPVPHNWIICATTDIDGRYFIGMTYHHNDFFAVDVSTGEVAFHDQVHAGSWGDSSCCHALASDCDGVIYGSYSMGYLFTYDSKKRELTETDVKLPGGRETFRVDSMTLGADGLIYVGTWETGILFSVEPKTLKVKELCHPNEGGARLPALVDRDGIIYGAAGGGKTYGTRDAFLFEYNSKTGAYREVGPMVEEDSGISASRVHAMTVGQDGTLYAGETGATRKYHEKDGEIATGMHAYLYVIDV